MGSKDVSRLQSREFGGFLYSFLNYSSYGYGMAEKPKILIVDDEKEIADLIEIHLTNEGFKVCKAANGQQALHALAEQSIQLVILDIMMPGIDGLELCRRIRRSMNIPILMLSAKSQDMDKVMGLSTGADDYLAKPFNVIELMARVKSQLRRYLYLNPNIGQDTGGDRIAAGDLVLNKASHQAIVGDREVILTATEFDILLLLASHPGRVFSAEEIFRKVWKDHYYSSNNAVMVHIRKIREKVEDDPGKPNRIKTVWGVGYRFES
jgi:two-component system, OmpR family, response regulator VanR